MTAVADHDTHGTDAEEHAPHEHPGLALYWRIGGILAVLTALEVSTYWWPNDWHRATAVVLVIMMVIKFTLVAMFFMHLKFDSKLLRRVFVGGLSMAVVIYLITLSAMTFWVDSGTPRYIDAPRTKPQPPPPTDAPTS